MREVKRYNYTKVKAREYKQEWWTITLFLLCGGRG
jgi:hypothetical protein